MLVLTRNVSEGITITTPSGEVIRIILVEVRGATKARIGITAADDVEILRDELLPKILTTILGPNGPEAIMGQDIGGES